MRILLSPLRAVAELAVLLAAAMAVASLGGTWKNRFDLLTHFSPLWFAVCAAGLAIVLIVGSRHRRLLIVAAVAGMAVSGGLMAPDLLAAAAPLSSTRPDERTLRVVSFNLSVRNADREATAAWLLASGADVLVLPEPQGAAAAVVRRLRGRYPHGIDCQGDEDCNAAVLSRWPVSASGAAVPYAWARLEAPGGPFTVIGAHFTWPTSGWEQAWQRRRVAQAIARLDRRTTIVAGDFNTAPWSFAMRRQDRMFGMERRTRALFSWPTGLPVPVLPIDHLYAGDGWRTVSARRGPRLGSDHYPVVVELQALPPGGGKGWDGGGGGAAGRGVGDNPPVSSGSARAGFKELDSPHRARGGAATPIPDPSPLQGEGG